MSSIRSCGDHGYFEDESCSLCGVRGEEQLSHSSRMQLSKFMSGALRHFPSDIGLKIDSRGWVSLSVFQQAVQDKFTWADASDVRAVIETDPKGRYEIDGNRVRAAYGHSVDVSISSENASIPDILYHGTAPRNIDSIMDEGLKPMNRNSVHLTDSLSDAREVGSRHAKDDPVILVVDAEQLIEDGRTIDVRGDNVFTTSTIQPEYISKK